MDIYDQVIEALTLEAELGTRTVEFDRALLAIEARAEVAGGRGRPPLPTNYQLPTNQLPTPNQLSTTKKPTPNQLPTTKKPTAKPPTANGVVFASRTGSSFEGEAGALFDRMLEKKGKTRADVTLETFARGPEAFAARMELIKPRQVVLFGSDTGGAFFAATHVRLARDNWKRMGAYSVILTVSPEFIVKQTAKMGAASTKAVREEVWRVLCTVFPPETKNKNGA